MSERRDDTTERAGESRRRENGARAKGDYYYDDGTGYEPFDPKDDDDEAAGDGGEPRSGGSQ